MDNKQKVIQKLSDLDISYELINHPAVFTIEEMDALNIDHKDAIVKNLFLRDAKGKRHFLVVIEKDKKADLKKLQQQLECSALSFASEERLERYLKLSKGSVTPLGIINDENCSVEVVFDKDLVGKEKLGVHPNDNTATVMISYVDLIKVIEHNGNKISLIEV